MGYTPAITPVVLGLGVSAMSDAGTTYAQNEKNQMRYETRIRNGDLAVQRGHVLSADDRLRHKHILKLVTQFATDFDACADASRLQQLRSDGLLTVDAKRVAVTPLGRSFLRNICMAYDARLQQAAQSVRNHTSRVL
jgi:oxygen-independent coproporphyrinogen-3 oxidase